MMNFFFNFDIIVNCCLMYLYKYFYCVQLIFFYLIIFDMCVFDNIKNIVVCIDNCIFFNKYYILIYVMKNNLINVFYLFY